MRMKRESEESEVFSKVKKEIVGSQSEKTDCGLFLYWGEGTKPLHVYGRHQYRSDALKVLCHWLGLFGYKSDS